MKEFGREQRRWCWGGLVTGTVPALPLLPIATGGQGHGGAETPPRVRVSATHNITLWFLSCFPEQ